MKLINLEARKGSHSIKDLEVLDLFISPSPKVCNQGVLDILWLVETSLQGPVQSKDEVQLLFDVVLVDIPQKIQAIRVIVTLRDLRFRRLLDSIRWRRDLLKKHMTQLKPLESRPTQGVLPALAMALAQWLVRWLKNKQYLCLWCLRVQCL